jgi:hypothetical protein
LEIRVQGEKAPIYDLTLEDLGRANDQPVLPFNAYGTLAWARNEFDNNSASSQVRGLQVSAAMLQRVFLAPMPTSRGGQHCAERASGPMAGGQSQQLLGPLLSCSGLLHLQVFFLLKVSSSDCEIHNGLLVLPVLISLSKMSHKKLHSIPLRSILASGTSWLFSVHSAALRAPSRHAA